MTFQEKSFDTGSLVLNYFEGPPSGQPLILLHGLTGRWQSFSQLISQLSPGYHIFAVDLRGHGKSGHISGEYHLQGYSEDITAFIRKGIGQNAILCGHSLGGAISLHIALTRPELVSAVIVGDTPLTPLATRQGAEAFLAVFGLWAELVDQGLPLRELALALGELPARPKPDGSPQFYKDFWSQTDLLYTARCIQLVDKEILTGVAEKAGSQEDDLLTQISQVTCPALFLQGDPGLGGLLADSELELALKEMPQAYGVRIRGAGHGIFQEQPVAATHAITDFLSANEL